MVPKEGSLPSAGERNWKRAEMMHDHRPNTSLGGLQALLRKGNPKI